MDFEATVRLVLLSKQHQQEKEIKVRKKNIVFEVITRLVFLSKQHRQEEGMSIILSFVRIKKRLEELEQKSNRTETNRRALIPVIINNDTEIQALCDPCADITVIQQSCVPNDIVINPWTDGQFQVVDHEIKPIGWISLNIIVGNLEHMMPKIGVCTQLPFKLILGFDWQQQVQARCTYDPNGSLWYFYSNFIQFVRMYSMLRKPSINCVALHPPLLPSLDDGYFGISNTQYNFIRNKPYP
ncbi:hypothetical protein HNY73_004299 [Argiope bruennichi]|uniref:Retropepsins domain-containing protein n=1 Tax=Argiope bruennichi TaxID=94029 RepID=A0A8T0FQ69_ARGBR|nr:hypothetical protein HNY73_004299 [Argiope bruennichi]